MICPNCGRRNSGGATFCSRCRQRLPLANKLNGNHRRTVMVEPRGGGGSGAIVLGVALLAAFLFIGGAAAIYLSSPPSDGGDGTDISFASSTPSLPIFVQPTATSSPTPSPTFILLPSESPTIPPSFTPLPTDTTNPPPTSRPTSRPTPRQSHAPRTPTPPPPTPKPVAAKFSCSQDGTSKTINCVDASTGGPTTWEWTFDDGSGTIPGQNQTHTYAAYGTYTVKLVVTGPGGNDTKTKTINVQAPPCSGPDEPPGCIPSPAPTEPPAPTPADTTPPVASALPASSESPTP